MDEPLESLDIIEKVPVLSMNQFGKRLTIILDRAINKRSDFLFLKRRFQNREGESEGDLEDPSGSGPKGQIDG
ncbi:MAG: hypothetical protein ACP5QK_12405 [Myxococcota bacterium]